MSSVVYTLQIFFWIWVCDKFCFLLIIAFFSIAGHNFEIKTLLY